MSLLRYTATVQLDVEATDTATIDKFIRALANAGTIIETKAKSLAAPKVKPKE